MLEKKEAGKCVCGACFSLFFKKNMYHRIRKLCCEVSVDSHCHREGGNGKREVYNALPSPVSSFLSFSSSLHHVPFTGN
jgi:hypothetical protein